MGLPQQIQKQAEAVEVFDKRVAEHQAAQAEPAEEPGEPQAPAEEPTKPPEAAPPVPPPQPAEDAALWKQRFLSLQGMFNSQVPVLQQQVKELRQALEARQQQPASEQKTQQRDHLLTQNDVEAFGEDLVDLVRRGAREEIAAIRAEYDGIVSSLREELSAARSEVSSVADSQTRTQSDRFFSDLSARIPNWKEIQGTPECQNFLGSHIPGTQTLWNDALTGAAQQFDLNAVLEVFGEFFTKHPQLDPNRKKAPAAPRGNQAELARQVAPPRTHAASPPPAQGKRMYTGAEYERESMQIVRLAQQGKHDEAARLESELNAALAEGRVR